VPQKKRFESAFNSKNLFASARWGEKLFVTPSAARRLKKLRKNRR
jgi:hypothetical protein